MTSAENPWKTFFDHHAPVYMQEAFTRNTEHEIEFIIDELSLPEGSHILDVGCGTGRHSIELAKLGFRLTGIDISIGMLAEAKKSASQAGVDVRLIQADASVIEFDEHFDAVICLCEGAFGLIGSSEDVLTHEKKILEAIHHSMKPGAKLILTLPNGLAKIRSATPEQVISGAFNPLTLTERFAIEIATPDGPQTLQLHERGFVPSELQLLFERVGFDVLAIYGGTAGAWNRVMVSLDEVEIMVLAVRV
ncbi:MAG: class I SAM-dependent methyltransferase [Anaerolineales bacterium]|jgi:SAM-dependent methyltransferase